jgi:subtilisin family serine protease
MKTFIAFILLLFTGFLMAQNARTDLSGALKKSNNDKYWDWIDTDYIVILFENNFDLNSKVVNDFIHDNNLQLVRQSKRKEIMNFGVYSISDGGINAIKEIILNASDKSFILGVEPRQFSIVDHKQKLKSEPNDPYWSIQWGPELIGADSISSFDISSNPNVWTAVLDLAIDWNHEDLQSTNWFGYDYGDDDDDPTPDNNSTQWHGTHVSGIIAAEENNGIGISGVAGSISNNMYFAKIQSASDAPNYAIYADVITDAVNDISQIEEVKVISMSLGFYQHSPLLEIACRTAYENGKLLIAAAGNSGYFNIAYPAIQEEVMAVGSVYHDVNEITVSNHSNRGDEIEICAPGGNDQSTSNEDYIIATFPDNSYDYLWGTSMACPHVAAVASIIFHMKPDLTNIEVRQILQETSMDLGTEGRDVYYGFGMVDAIKSIEAVTDLITNVDISLVEDHIQVFPNPIKRGEQLNIQMEDKSISYLQLISITGDIIVDSYQNEKIFVVPDNLSSGVYFLRITDKSHCLSNHKITIY